MNKQAAYLFVLSVFCLGSCTSQSGKNEKKEPAHMNNPIKESELNTITLTTDAVRRLGVQVEAVDSREVSDKRTYSAEVMAIPGQTVSITAPIAGTLISVSLDITAGRQLRSGEAIFKLAILPSEKDAIGVNEDIIRLEQQYEVSKQKLERARQLYNEQAGSLRAQQEAEAELAGIGATLRVARSRKELLQGNTSAAVTSRLSLLSIKSPISGVLQRLYGSPNQVVAAAAPIADVARTDKLWIRVPLYAGDINKVDRSANADVMLLSDHSGSSGSLPGIPVQGPKTADPLTTSVDVYYEVSNSHGELTPGSRVSVEIASKMQKQGLTLPYSAVVYDIHGGTWVYVNTDGLSYTRQRVELDGVNGSQAVIRRGLNGNEKVVTVGAAELFGFEFGGGK